MINRLKYYVLQLGDLYPYPLPTPQVVAGRYKIPNGFSANAADLISKMLVVEPKTRIRIRGIIAHPWFQVWVCVCGGHRVHGGTSMHPKGVA